MSVLHASVTLAHRSGKPRDQVVNTFTFQVPDGTEGAAVDVIQGKLDAFYNHAYNAYYISSFLSPAISRTVLPVLRVTNVTGHLNGSAAGSPMGLRTLNALQAAADTGPLPSEVAVCLSFHSPYNSDAEFAPGTRPRARDRGRVYLGPLNRAGALLATDGSTGCARVGATARDCILGAGEALATVGTDGVGWAVWSRRKAATALVGGMWVDDAFDVQRRRGEDSSARSTFESVPV